MPCSHVQWGQSACDFVVKILSRNIRISARAQQQGRRFDQTLLDGEVQQPPIWAGRIDQGRVIIQQRFGPIEPIECDCR